MRVSKLGFGLLLWLFIATAQALTFPALSGRVVDDGQMLDPATREQLTQTLQAHEKATGEQVVVVTVPNLQGTPIEDFGYQLGRAWGIGQKDKNNGALLIVARDDRKLRIEVGYGLEDRLTDAQASVIINRSSPRPLKPGTTTKVSATVWVPSCKYWAARPWPSRPTPAGRATAVTSWVSTRAWFCCCFCCSWWS